MGAARSNRERSETTREAMLAAARALFISQGYADTSTPDVCAAAGITRGALYHHFADKRDLFRQVLEREAAAVTAEIEASMQGPMSAAEALVAGSEAYLDAMAVPGRTRLILIEGQAVLGTAEMTVVDESSVGGSLREGLVAAHGDRRDVSVDALAKLLSAAFDRAALEIDAGADAAEVRTAMLWLLQRALADGV